jgi:hypothetical protein
MSDTPTQPRTVNEQIHELRAVINTLASSLATMKGNQSQLDVAVNRLQSDKLQADGSTGTSTARDLIATNVRHGHKMLFSTYDGTEDPLSWLNRCKQFFRIQGTEEAGKVFLASFYMMGDTWYTLIEKNHGTPTWAEFDKLVHQCFGPPLCGNALDELIQLQHETTVADYQSMFLALVTRCNDLIEKHQIDIFTNHLHQWCPPL